jgi:hypothetical protein
MKKISFMLLGFVYVNLISGQCACCGSSSNLSAGETTPMAYSLNKKQWLAELYSDYRSFTGSGSNTLSDHQISNALSIKDMVITGVGLRYGINNRTALVIQQPYIFMNATTTRSEAFGDLLSLLNYRASSRSNFIVGLQAGMEWPTGQYIISATGNSISTGSGSYDPVAGFNVIKAFKRSNIRANAFFKYTTQGFNQTNYGDFFGHQLGYSYFVLQQNPSCTPDSISGNSNDRISLCLNVQLSGEWSQAQMKDHAMLPNTGSYVALAGAGIVIGCKGFSIPLMVTVPVYRQFYGEQNLNVFRIRIGLTKTFN